MDYNYRNKSDDADEDSCEEPIPFETNDKATTLQQCRVFNDVPLNVPTCTKALLQALNLIYTHADLNEAEATTLFFLSTKLLQSPDTKLRRLLYLLMK